MRVPVARILSWPWLTSSLHTSGQYMAVDSIKRSLPSALSMTARLQESRAEAGVVAAPRTEAHRLAVQIKGPRDRDQLAACRLALSEWDSSD